MWCCSWTSSSSNCTSSYHIHRWISTRTHKHRGAESLIDVFISSFLPLSQVGAVNQGLNLTCCDLHLFKRRRYLHSSFYSGHNRTDKKWHAVKKKNKNPPPTLHFAGFGFILKSVVFLWDRSRKQSANQKPPPLTVSSCFPMQTTVHQTWTCSEAKCEHFNTRSVMKRHFYQQRDNKVKTFDSTWRFYSGVYLNSAHRAVCLL